MKGPIQKVMVALALAGILGLSALAVAEEKKEKKPDATFEFDAGVAAIGIGYSWGHGKLNYHGKTYGFKVEGLSVGSVGGAKVDGNGNVYNLKKVEDFSGTYQALGAGATIGGGGGVVAMKNTNGVEISVKAKTQGVTVTAAVSGVTLTLEK
jgi:hypothetical protein